MALSVRPPQKKGLNEIKRTLVARSGDLSAMPFLKESSWAYMVGGVVLRPGGMW